VDNQPTLTELEKQLAALQKENHQLNQSLHVLKDYSDRWKDLIDSAADTIFIGNPDGSIIYANKSATLLTHYSNQELLSMNLGELFTEKERQRSPLRYELLNQGKTVKTERLLSRKDGSTVPIEMNSKMLPDGTYHSFFRDMSERKQAEEILRVSEKKFSQIFHLSPDAIALTRISDGMFIDVNQAYCDISGWSREEVIGSSSLAGGINIWNHQQDRERMVKLLRETGEVQGLEAEFRGKDGNIIIGLLSARIIEITGETYVLTVTKDINNWKSLLKKQQKLEEQMLQAQKLESLGVLAGGIAHDFNNILMAVIGHCDLAQRRLPVESPAMENLRQINLAASRAADLANQMLAYSGKGKFVVEALNLSQIIIEMEHILSVSVSKKAVLRFDLEKDLPSVEADATQLQQIIMNLVINASDAIGDDNGTIAISTGSMDCDTAYLQENWLNDSLTPGHYVFLEVADTGCGIAETDVNRIFEPFYSTKFTGRGLGMAAVMGIVRGHKGAIKIYTELGKGSTIKVLLPASSLSATSQGPASDTTILQETGTVLLVDDEETVRDIGQEMLSDFGFVSLTACNGIEALEIFREHHKKIRFVLMDLTMPKMGGEETFREFRRINPNIKVIICSGYNEQEISQKFAGKGLAGFLKKPYTLSELQDKIKYVLQK
jgi:PAS domain S-box-containing protein